MQALIGVAPYSLSLSLSLSLSGEMRGLEGRAVVGSFNAQDVANTLPLSLSTRIFSSMLHDTKN